MSEEGGPWGAKDETPSAIPRHRWLIWLAVMGAMIAAFWALAHAFPDALRSGEDWAWLLRGLVLMVVVSAAILGAGRVDWRQKMRHAGIWAGLVMILILGMTYRSELAGVGQRVRMAMSSSYPVATGAHELVVTQAGDGGFVVMGKVNGQPVRFLVDTGASDTVLSPDDAKRVGIDLSSLRYDKPAETANGVGWNAAHVLDSLAVGSIGFTDVPVMINQAPMSGSLLGMSFLQRLESFQVKGDKLYLRSHP